MLPEYLRSAAMTAEWENRLLQIERGELPGQEFLDGIEELIDRMLLECGELSVEEQNRFYPREQIGVCPVCGSPVYESKRNFFCGSRECAFALWKENRYLSGMKKRMDKKMAAELLKDGRTYVPDLYFQKKGRTFAAYHLPGYGRKEKPVSAWSSRKRQKQKMKTAYPGREPGRAGLYKRGKTVFTCMKQTPQPAPYRDNL